VQDFANYNQITELDSVCDFKQEMEEFRGVLVKVEEHNATRLKMSAELADVSQLVKSLVIRAEDARLLGDMAQMRRTYTELYTRNRAMIGEHKIRSNNHEELLVCLKKVNHMIQKAGRLRVGEAKTKVVSLCRNALKTNNMPALFRIIETGRSA